MPFEVIPVSNATADAILAWCGVTSPTPADIAIATMAATSAEETIRHYRGQAATEPIEPEYQALAVEMGVYAYTKRGVDGVLSFSENGVAQSYEQGSFPKSMLARITPPTRTQ